MRITQCLPVMVSGLFLLAALSMSGAQPVVPDATSRSQAIQMGLSQGKPILLVVSDTNNCSGCIQLEYLTLPSTDSPPMKQFLKESFIYWSCGPQEHWEEFRIYTGQGTVSLPSFFIIDPATPDTYTASGFGSADPVIFYNWAASALHVSTKPKIDAQSLTNNQIVPTNQIVVWGKSISTNVLIRAVYYKLNNGAWTYSSVPDWQNWRVTLNPQAVAMGPNTFQVYSVDASWTDSRTNQLSFTYQTNAIILPATVTLGSLSQTYDGNAKTVTATTTPTGLAVNLTYNGSPNAPTNSGTYTVIGTVNDPSYQGGATNTLTVSKAEAVVTLGNLSQIYDGTAKSVTATTTPLGFTVRFTYNGLTNVPINVGSYPVVGIVSDANYTGSTNDTLVIGQAAATVVLGNLSQTYDGTAKSVTVTTTPTGLTVSLTYNGLPNAPTNVGNYTVVGTVSEPNYQGSVTNTLVIGEPPPAPVLISLNPTQVTPGGDVFFLVATGTNFVTNSVIRWNGVAQNTKYLSSTSLRSTIESDLIAAPGTVSITVFNPSGGGESLPKPLFIGEPPAPPVITSLNPSQVQPGGDAFFLIVTGTNFLTNSVIRWKGVDQTTKYLSNTSLRTTIEAELIASAGTASITVFNPGLSGGESAPQSLAIGTPAPKMTVERSDSTLIIGWPTNAIGFTLESTPILPGTNWLSVPGSETNNSMVVPIGVDNQFYRLKK